VLAYGDNADFTDKHFIGDKEPGWGRSTHLRSDPSWPS
jgi:hypothetical protein